MLLFNITKVDVSGCSIHRIKVYIELHLQKKKITKLHISLNNIE